MATTAMLVGSRATLPGAPPEDRTLQSLRVKEVPSPAGLEEHFLVGGS